MKLPTTGSTRRGALLLLTLAGALALLPGCDPTLRRRQEHVLNRIGYGPDPWSLARIEQLGINGYIEEQLYPQQLDDSALESQIRSLLPSTAWPLYQIRDTYNEYVPPPLPGVGHPIYELAQAKLLRAVASKRQLEQVLVDFWFNHFNVDGRYETQRWATTTYERDAIRPHVLGRFRDLLRATAAHPAMLDYLDNHVNFAEGFYRDGYVYGPNENYAREVLELHTVGVDAPYTLTDIQEVARVFTGWTFHTVLSVYTPGFVYLDAGHDKGAKSVMGLQIPAGGNISDGEALIDYLAGHPLTAIFVARKLCRRFVSENPRQGLVDLVAFTFWSTGGDLRQVMRTLLLSSDFLDATDYRMKLKRPFHWLASTARAVGISDPAAFAPWGAGQLVSLGEQLYAAPPPTGYPDVSSAWTGEGPFLARVNNAFRAADGQSGFAPLAPTFGTSPAAIANELQMRFMPSESLAPAALADFETFLQGIPADERVEQAAAALLASPAFMMH